MTTTIHNRGGVVEGSVPGLPERVTATLADDGPDGWAVFRLADRRGYTHREDTIRVGRYSNVHDGRIERMTRDGWKHLAGIDGGGHGSEPDWHEAVHRAVAILYGMEDHG